MDELLLHEVLKDMFPDGATPEEVEMLVHIYLTNYSFAMTQIKKMQEENDKLKKNIYKLIKILKQFSID